MWILLALALAGTETDCNAIDDDFDGEIDEGADCGGECIPLLHTNGTNFLVCDNFGPLQILDAQLLCGSIGYEVAVPRDAAEQNLITSVMAPTHDYWLGLSDFDAEGIWETIAQGESLTYFAWDLDFVPPQPDGTTGEDCAYAYSDAEIPHQWHDITCDGTTLVESFVCEARCHPVTWYDDVDGDGYGGGPAQVACDDTPPGSVSQGGDCDDLNPSRNPGIAVDVCNGVDDDCDGQTDEDEPPLTFYEDGDGDGYGNGDVSVDACDQPSGYVPDSSDCNDDDSSAYPAATEVCDGDLEDCNGSIDAGLTSTFWLDSDNDGYGDAGNSLQACSLPGGYRSNPDDCDDGDATAYPGATEVCDGDLEDCNGSIDAGVTATFWLDSDGDGFGDADASVQACALPDGYALSDTDCDDGDLSIYPGATEVCDGADNDCDSQTDEGVLNTYWEDDDADGYGNSALPTAACSQPPGTVPNPDDCDDARAAAYPGAPETCNNLDDDCDNVVDNGTDDVQWYIDGDGDGFGNAPGLFQCEQPTGQVSTAGDCNDSNPAINPAAEEICDSVDHDCDGEDWNGLVITEFWPDVDGDGYGAGNSVLTCETSQAGHVSNGDDCDDTASAVNPAAEEICDTIDNDCDNLVDDADTVPNPDVWYPDADQDDYGDTLHPILACLQPADTTDRDGDCDDTEPSVYEGAPEACVDGLDNDCDDLVDADDPDFVNGGVAYAQDNDDDGFGDPFNSALACSGEQPLGWVPLNRGEDCDDGNSLRNPGLDEECDGIDNDCVGGVDNGLFFLDYFVDDDGDGFGNPNSTTINACAPIAGRSSNGLDCDDNDNLVNPNAAEVCNGEDDNCNVLIDDGLASEDYYPDLDGDGFGDALASAETSCSTISGKVTDATDCDDTDGHIYPGAPEDPIDGIDSDCDGTAEEIPPQRLPDTDGDGVPDSIDLVDPTGEDPPDPPAKDYGCGCTSSAGARGWLTWLRRR